MSAITTNCGPKCGPLSNLLRFLNNFSTFLHASSHVTHFGTHLNHLKSSQSVPETMWRQKKFKVGWISPVGLHCKNMMEKAEYF